MTLDLYGENEGLFALFDDKLDFLKQKQWHPDNRARWDGVNDLIILNDNEWNDL